MDKFNILNISTIAVIKSKSKDEAEINLQATLGVDKLFGNGGQQAQFQMIYKDFYCVFTVETQELAEKWVNSIKLVQDELKAEG
jgi:hypothetical protein